MVQNRRRYLSSPVDPLLRRFHMQDITRTTCIFFLAASALFGLIFWALFIAPLLRVIILRFTPRSLQALNWFRKLVTLEL